jgi:hypothetical protein
MQNQTPTDKHLNRLIEFRQAVYRSGFTQRRDAQFELLDALLLAGPVNSFPELSLCPIFQRQWPSAYAAMEDGRQDQQWLKEYLCRQVTPQGVAVFALDTTAWPRPQAATLPDRQYVYHPTSAVVGDSVVVGNPYSVLAWVAKERSSWALPVDIQRVASSSDAIQVGAEQVKALCQHRQGLEQGFSLIVGDGRYGNPRFLGLLKDQPCGVLVRLRRDRVLYRQPPPYRGRGRPREHGQRFAFKEPDTWGVPEQQCQFQDPRWGRVVLSYWGDLHAREAADIPFGVLQAQVHLEKERPPAPLWLAWQGPAWPADLLWRAYQQRWPVEPSIRWRKEQLHWTLPQSQDQEACERWTMLVTLAQWTLYLARPLVQPRSLPWQQGQRELTPGRVRRGLGALFLQIGTPAAVCQRRGKSPGWPKGRVRSHPIRYPVVKKGSIKAKAGDKAA